MRMRLATTAALIALVSLLGEAASPASNLADLAFLLGRWSASGGGQPGQGTGETTFERTLQDHAIIRENFAEYPASPTSPASRHDDLMVIFPGADGSLSADYYDSEGQHIHYIVELPSANRAVFLSDVTVGAPRYRLTYQLNATGHLQGEFAIAPPDHPDDFAQYLTWDSVRVPGGQPRQ